MTIGAVGAIAFAASNAFFSDEETSTGNTFVAGSIDLKVDSEAHYDGLVCRGGVWVEEDATKPTTRPDLLGDECGGTWDSRDLTIEKFFDYSDIKPGDEGENTISLTGSSNPYWACVNIIPTMNDDVTTNEPELEAGDVENTDSIYDGELAQNLVFEIWSDTDCDNVKDDGELPLTTGSGPVTPRSWAIADSVTGNVPLSPDVKYCLGVAWSLPGTVGNMVQTDKYMADISFYIEQARNNKEFKCTVQEGFTPNKLRLENEVQTQSGPWTVLSEDQIYADLTWDGDGNDFVYDLHAKGLANTTPYTLIYYADGWPGNNPGALIGEHTTSATGTIDVDNVVKNLGMDLPTLPDGNFAVGAKIWLIPSSAYDSVSHSVTTWPPDFNTWLFEGNVYIHYTDMNKPL